MSRKLTDDESEILRRFWEFGFYNASSAIRDVAARSYPEHARKYGLKTSSMPKISGLEEMPGLKLRLHFKRSFPRFEQIPPLDIDLLSCAYKHDTLSLVGKYGYYANRR